MELPPRLNAVTGEIIGAAIEVHRYFGPGLFESTYVPCLHQELKARGLNYEAQLPVPLIYKGLRLDASYRVDLVVECDVIVELKAIEQLLPVHESQVLTYLRLTDRPVGLLINFNVPRLIDGVKRLVNTKRREMGPQPW
jgi:GxxExxY protein